MIILALLTQRSGMGDVRAGERVRGRDGLYAFCVSALAVRCLASKRPAARKLLGGTIITVR